MKNFFIALVLALAFSACTSFDALRGAVRERGAEAYDEALDTAEFTQCNAASVGSVFRRYGADKELWDSWKTICRRSNAYDPDAPLEVVE